jgi:POT family proton-dependent oligopeptide transporter
MAFGSCSLALANLLMAAAAASTAGKASPLWLVGYFMLATIGELYLAPIGLALVTRTAPPRMLSMMMGVWFATTLPADILGGFLGGFWSSLAKEHFFLLIAGIAATAGIGLYSLGRLHSINRDPSR